MTAVEIIDETVSFYSEDVSRRAVTNGLCSYYDENNNSCALSRLTRNANEFKLFVDTLPLSDTSIKYVVENNVNLDKWLLSEYQGFELEFYEDLQCLHDSDEYWIGIDAERLRSEKVHELKERWGEKIKQNGNS